ncbi:MAG: hypothetical protein K9H16_11065 [Bacteroidales bacterium]|nr:hypothetical protein [Bacteroidales bacterium]
MGIVREPEGVDFLIKSKPLTKKQEIELSEYIAQRKREIKKQAAEGIIKRKRKKTPIV